MIATDIDFPAGLPCPLRDGYDLNPVQSFMRTPMDSGRARQRRKFTSVPEMVNVSWHFQDNEAAAFEAWFRDAIHDGADWFNIELKTPVGVQPYVARFTEMYKGGRIIGKSSWRFQAALELYERPLMPPGWGLMPEFVIGASIFDVAMNREWPLAYPGAQEPFVMTETGEVLTLESGQPPPAGAVKISELPTAAPLSGAEYIPVLQSGVTKKSKASDISKSDDTNYAFYYGMSKD